MSSVFQYSNLTDQVYLPEDDAERIIRITELFNETATAVNIREIALYDPTETPTGQQWLNSVYQNQQPLIPFRKIFTGNLIATGTITIPHGIVGIIFCTKIEGTAAKPDKSLFIPIPQAAPDDVSITVDQNNIYITTSTATYNTFVAVITLEYFRSGA